MNPAWRVEDAIEAKQKGVIAGLPLAAKLFASLDSSVHFRSAVLEGTQVKPGQRIALIRGKARSILSAERPALNDNPKHLSGDRQTFPRGRVRKLQAGQKSVFSAIRGKTSLPGWRVLQKYAVRCGGASNHRMSLGDEVMIKENHLEDRALGGR